MSDARDIRSIFLTLTAGCNLSCAYCFQNRKTSERMSWETLRAALDFALASWHRELRIVFFGGEPLLEFALIRRAVDHVRRCAPEDKAVRFEMSTNGTLLRGAVAEFLVEHDFGVQVSFDGVPAAQDLRGRGTFAVLDERLEQLAALDRAFFERRVNVSMALLPSTVPHLAASVCYFLGKGLREIQVYPTFTDSRSWRRDDIAVLDEQFRRIHDACVRHFERTGSVPFLPFAGHTDGTPRAGGRLAMCGVSSGTVPAIDVDGQVYACATFVESGQRLPRWLGERLAPLRLGRTDDQDFVARYRGLGDAVERAGLFSDKQDKYSAYGRCRECEFLESCAICPVSIGHQPDNRDPRRVPDFMCAFNLVCGKYSRLFSIRHHGETGALRLNAGRDLRRVLEAAETLRRGVRP